MTTHKKLQINYFLNQLKFVKIMRIQLGFLPINNNISIEYYLSLKSKDLMILDKQTIKLKPLNQNKHQNCHQKASIFSYMQELEDFKENGRFIALKLISKQFIIEHQKQQIVQNERDVMVQLNLSDQYMAKSFVCQLECAFGTKNCVYFGMEYCLMVNYSINYENLEDEFGLGKNLFIEVYIAIGFLHKKKYCIEMQNQIPNMGQFDETFHFAGHQKYYIDYYCLGALLYELLTGLPSFYQKNTNEIFQSILNDDAKDLLKRLLIKFLRVQTLQTSQKGKCNLHFLPNLIKFNFDPKEFKQGGQQFNQELQKSIQSDKDTISILQLKFDKQTNRTQSLIEAQQDILMTDRIKKNFNSNNSINMSPKRGFLAKQLQVEHTQRKRN
ncbi:unnamed protein product [Paramecium octaurelia]|uniref:non-specific serine/threonine protein kinase n=1 Tax=Paramecium octaurelia TaxID=43137 RepID=A0A8S1WQA0_PAROT|nr:unnamed protein product [Paramecium octaurelia]